MLVAIAIGLQSGLLLGGRFKILSTVPVALAAACVIAGTAAGGHLTLGAALLEFMAFSLSLQSGYIIMLLAGPRPQVPARISPSRA